MKQQWLWTGTLVALVGAVGCGEDPASGDSASMAVLPAADMTPSAVVSGIGGAENDAPVPTPDDGCTGDVLTADTSLAPLSGPGLVDGALPPGQYAISTTHLRLKEGPATMARFSELLQPVLGQLGSSDGLVAQSLAVSSSCGTARTLTVWRDVDAMYAFVLSPAHAAAVAAVSEVSRGNSIAMHWIGSAEEANWQKAAEQLGAWTGRVY